MLRDAGAAVAIVTNQAAVGKGLASLDEVVALHARMLVGLCPAPLSLKDVYVCPHVEEDGCDCRKPRPGLLLKALHDHDQRAETSFFIGDTWRDAKAAQAAGIPFALVYTGNGRQEEAHIRADGVPFTGAFENLLSAVTYLLRKD